MTFPVVEERITGVDHDGYSGSLTVNLPSTVAANDLLLLVVQTFSGGTLQGPPTISGWTRIFDVTAHASDSNNRLSAFAKVADGSEGGTSVSVDYTESNFSGTYHVFRISNWAGSLSGVENATNTGSSDILDPPSLIASWGAEDTLWIALAGQRDTEADITSGPQGFTNFLSTNPASNRPVIASAWLEDNVSSKDPDAFTSDTTYNYQAATLAIRPGAGGATVAVDDATHGHTAQEAGLSQVHDLGVDAAAHGHVADPAGIAQTHILGVEAAQHAHSAEQATVGQTHALAVSGTAHAHLADQVTIDVAGIVQPEDASHAHTAAGVTLSQVHIVGPDEAVHAHTAETATASEAGQLQPDDAAHGHTTAQAGISQAHLVDIAESVHALTTDQVTVGQVHVVGIDEATHAHRADRVSLGTGHIVAVADAAHGQAADTVDIDQFHDLVVAGAAHSHSADAVTLAQLHFLAANGALHAHTAGQAVVTEQAPQAPADRTLGIGADSRTLGIGADSRTKRISTSS